MNIQLLDPKVQEVYGYAGYKYESENGQEWLIVVNNDGQWAYEPLSFDSGVKNPADFSGLHESNTAAEAHLENWLAEDHE